MTVGVLKPFDRRARHQEGLQNPVFYQSDRPRFYALVVEFVKPVQIHGTDVLFGWVEDHREEIRQYAGPYALGEGLSLAFITLPVTFHAVTENLVKENTGGAARQDGWSDKWLDDRGMQQLGQMAA